MVHSRVTLLQRGENFKHDKRSEQHLGPKHHLALLQERNLDPLLIGKETVQRRDAPNGRGRTNRVRGDISATKVSPVQGEQSTDSAC